MQRRFGLDLEVSDEFGYGLAWYVTGEGYFGAGVYDRAHHGYKQLILRFYIAVRADDHPGLEYIRDTLGIGKIYEKTTYGNSAPQVRYEVSRIADLYHVIVPLFEKYPLPKQWRKARDFHVWKQLVNIKYHKGGMQYRVGQSGSCRLPESYWNELKRLIAILKDGRKFKPSRQSPEALS